MGRGYSVISRPLVVAVVFVLAAAACVAAAQSRVADNGVLNQAVTQDPTGDSNGGADLSSLTVTTYTDGSIQFDLRFANRDVLPVGESAQLFIDLDDDGIGDLVMSDWPGGAPSDLYRWDGAAWVPIRGLPEAVETSGLYSVRLPLSVLDAAAGMASGNQLGVRAGSWTTDPATNLDRSVADDWLPNNQGWSQFQIQPPAAPPTTAPTTPATPTTAAPSKLTVTCVKHAVHASLAPGKGSKVSSVGFSVDGTIEVTDSKAPFAALLSTKGRRTPLTVGAIVHVVGKTQTLRKHVGGC